VRPEQLTPPQQAELLHAFQDHPRFCREALRIRERIGSTVPFECWPSQIKLNGAIKRQRARRRPVRQVVLKTRRSGFTMGSCSEMFQDVPFFPGRRGLVIADHYDPAGLEAFDYLVQFQMGYVPFGPFPGAKIALPKLLKPEPHRLVSPVPKGATLELLWDNGSAIDVMSAEGGNVGRGGGRHWILGDEAAFWRSAEVTLTAVLNMVPDLPETDVILQSTANGLGGEFYELCQKAQDPASGSGFEFLFFGWLEHPLYRLAFEHAADEVHLADHLDREEGELHELRGATLQQLHWRRRKIATECRGHIELFHQEYPTTPDEAFLSSGRPALTISTLVRMPVWKDPLVGELQEVEEFPHKRLQFVPREHGALIVGKKPEAGKSYALAADPAKGIDVSEGKRGTDPDWAVSGVFDLDTGEQVAMLRERIRPVPFAEYIALLGRLYNWAFLIPESNDAGFIDALLRTKYPLERIYTTRRDPTDRRSIQPQEIGFYTDATTRPWLVSALDDDMRTLAIIIRSPIAQQECRTFVIKPNGKAEHQVGCHDDCVIMCGLFSVGRRVAPRKLMRAAVDAARARVSTYGKRRDREDHED
jgi:hypothetical protein